MNNITSPKISIIVPVYKAENYIHRCIKSLLSQTFTDFEILLINDGSPDKSGEICNEYAKSDKRIRVFHKENGGVSSARQCGIDNAKGEYTIHVDPDDWVEPTMLEELYLKAVEENADMVICDMIKYYSNDKQIYIKQQPSSLEHQIVLEELFKHLQGSCCNKLIRKSCYDNYNIEFPKRFNLYEDLYICTCILKHPIKVSYLAKSFYFYDLSANTNSMVKRIDYKTLQEDKVFYETMTKVLENNISAYLLFKKNMSYPIVLRAIKAKYYSHKDFVLNYKEFQKYILHAPNGNVIGKIICYLSYYGLYSIIKKYL